MSYIEREAALQIIDNYAKTVSEDGKVVVNAIRDIVEVITPTADVVKIPEGGIGDLSDGYHTFNELYHHRAILFSVICNSMPDKAWKSKLHDTGDMYDGMFIVGIETPDGQATYHYDIDPYWDMFKVKELEKTPEWDGHTPQVAIERIAKLSADVVEVVRCKNCKFSSLEWIGGDLEGICKCGSAMINITPNSYCSCGERSEKGETMSTLEKAVATYGKDMQLTVACEELSELIKEICKNIRGSDNVERITEEMADCYIMMDQLAIIFGIKNCDINAFIDEKLARLEKRMAEREKAPGENREEVWEKNLERFKNGEFGECHTYEALAKYWKAQAEAGYPGANDSFNYFLSCVQERDGER